MTHNTLAAAPGLHRSARIRWLEQYDWWLLSALASLLAVGIIMVFSASYYEGLLRAAPDGLYFLKRQVLWLVAGLTVFLVAAAVPHRIWQSLSPAMFIVACLGLIAVLTVGTRAFGSQRLLFGASFQPSEVMKIVMIFYTSHWLDSKGEKLRDNNTGLYPFSLFTAFVAILLVMQPDITMAILISTTAFALFFLASRNLRQLLWVGILFAVLIVAAATLYPYMTERILDFRDSFADPLNSASWQERNTARAAVRGGLFGTGPGQGEMKTLWVVLPWTDSIFAVIGEETGFAGSIAVIGLYAVIAWRGLTIAARATTLFRQLTAVGLIFMLMTQALLHVCVVLNITPVTGMTLPFVSFGGSSLVTWLGAMGVLVNIDHTTRIQVHP